MAIYGVALLAACYIVGIFLGDVFGGLVGVKANVGGVGFAMLFLILLSNRALMKAKAQSGIAFWSAMYIPIVVAMSSIQNVVAALKGGPLAIGGGVVGVAVAFALIPIIGKLFGKKEVK